MTSDISGGDNLHPGAVIGRTAFFILDVREFNIIDGAAAMMPYGLPDLMAGTIQRDIAQIEGHSRIHQEPTLAVTRARRVAIRLDDRGEHIRTDDR